MAEEERMMMRKQVTKSKYEKLTNFLKTILLATLTFKAEREAAFLGFLSLLQGMNLL